MPCRDGEETAQRAGEKSKRHARNQIERQSKHEDGQNELRGQGAAAPPFDLHCAMSG